MPQLLSVCHDLHGPAAQDEAGAHQHGVADLLGGGNAVFNVGHGLALGPGDVQLVQEVFKLVPVLGPVDGGAVRADDGHAPLHQGVCQVDGGLAAQGGNDALGVLEVQDVHHILGGQGLKVQLVGGGVVRGDGFGVVVDDDGFKAFAADGVHGMDGGVVEFHALADADGACTQDHHLLFLRQPGVVRACIGGVEVGDISAGVAGIHHAVYGEDVLLAAQAINLQLLHAPKLSNELVAEAHGLGGFQGFHIADVCFQRPLHVHDLLNGADEEGGDLGHLVDGVHADIPAQQLGHGEDGVVPELLQVLQNLGGIHAVEFRHIKVAYADLQGPDGFQQAPPDWSQCP